MSASQNYIKNMQLKKKKKTKNKKNPKLFQKFNC